MLNYHKYGRTRSRFSRQNRRRNDNLEQQAQNIFNHYFIESQTELGPYSEGFLTDIAVYLNGLAMQKFRPEGSDSGLPVLKIKELGQRSCDNNSDRCSSFIKDEYIVNDGDVIFSWSGTLLVDLWCGGRCGLNQHLFKVTSDSYPTWFYYFWTKHHLDNFIRVAKDKAVTMGHIKRTELEKANVIIPSKEKLSEIDKILSPIIDGIITHRVEMRRLVQLRDSLLPELMSGELKISEIDC
ncbi:MAG: restriction endonuclease subunit S [Bacteroidales bacterium]|nr:restriction endonuclease subunit S [Bacteroidales bacterium]